MDGEARRLTWLLTLGPDSRAIQAFFAPGRGGRWLRNRDPSQGRHRPPTRPQLPGGPPAVLRSLSAAPRAGEARLRPGAARAQRQRARAPCPPPTTGGQLHEVSNTGASSSITFDELNAIYRTACNQGTPNVCESWDSPQWNDRDPPGQSDYTSLQEAAAQVLGTGDKLNRFRSTGENWGVDH